MRGCLISPREGRLPQVHGFTSKRLKGFEPSTFCMATTRAVHEFRARTIDFAGACRMGRPALGGVNRRRYASVCAVSGTSCQKFPKARRVVPTGRAPPPAPPGTFEIRAHAGAAQNYRLERRLRLLRLARPRGGVGPLSAQLPRLSLMNLELASCLNSTGS